MRRIRTRTEKAKMNIAVSFLQELVVVVCNLILPRLILQNFGSAYNGIVTSVTQFLQLISLLNLGVTASTRVALYKTLANNDIESTSAVLNATDRYMKRVGLILLGYVGVLAVVYPLVLDTDFSYGNVALIILAVGIHSFAEYFWGITNATLLGADQCIYVTNLFHIVATIVNTIIAVLLISCGCSIQVVKFGSAAVFCIKPLLQNYYVRKKYKINKKTPPSKEAFAKRKDAMAHAIANVIHEKTSVIVLTLFASIETVSVYTIYCLITSALQKAQTIFTTGFEPIFGNMWVKKETEKIKNLLSLYEYGVAALTSVLFSVAIVMAIPFVKLYTAGVNDVEYVLPAYSFVAMLAVAFQGMRAPYITLVQGIGHYKQTKMAAYMEAAINVVLAVILVNIIGIVGVAIAVLAANLFRATQYAIYIDNHIVPRGKKVFIGRFIWTMMNIMLVVLLCYRTADLYAAENFIRWIGCACVVGVISLLITFVTSLLFYKADMKAAAKIATRTLARKVGHKE